MARRNRDLAGLAALGALGYYMARGGKQSGANVPVDDRGTSARPSVRPSVAPAAAAADVDPDLAREIARGSRGPIAISEGRVRPSAPARVSSAADSVEEMDPRAALPQEVPSRGRREMPPRRNVAGDYTRKMGATAEEIAAYNRAPVATRAPAPRAALTREELISQIPTSTGSRYGSVASDTDPTLRETGSEFGRNVSNTLAALTPLGGGFGKVGAELATAKGAAERAARSRELAEEAIRTQRPTKLTSTQSTAPARTSAATKSRVKKFNEEEAGVEFKRGGATKTKLKKMASGGFASASKRADGIASRGKTKCKMY